MTSAWIRGSAGLLAAALLLAPVGRALSAAPQAPLPTPVLPPETDSADAAEVVYAAPTRPDRAGRIMAPVFINDRGPFAFIVDTGASRSAIAPRTAARLGLVPDPSQKLLLRGITGTEEVPSLMVERLQAGDIVLEDQQLPVIVSRVFADAHGILGVDGFERMCLKANFDANSISITADRCPRLRRDWVRIRATLHFKQLMQVNATIRGLPVKAIIDTGAERSLGNPALLRALSLGRRKENPTSGTEVLGATSHTAEGNLLAIPTLYLGKIRIRTLHVVFGDFDVFHLWNLANEPAIIVGMDILGTVSALMIDYANVELRILPKRAPIPPMIFQNAGASRIGR